MNVALRSTRALGASAALVAAITSVGLVAGPSASADTVMTATTAVNVRAGASTTSAVLGVLRTGTTVTAVNASSNGWTQVSFNGRTAYVYSAYLTTATTPTTLTAPTTSTTSTTAATLEAVNVRTGPGINYPVTDVFPKTRTITITATTSNGYTQLTDGRWISTAWITKPTTTTPATTPTRTPTVTPTPTPTPAPVPEITGQVRATAALMIRTTPGTDYTSLGDVPAGTILNIIGTTTNALARIIYDGASRWVNAAYITPLTTTGPTATAASTAVSFATAQVGKAYAWGGNGPNAYDCSGLTTAAYKAAGIAIPRTSYSQFTVGTAVTLANLRPGDLVFYYSGISHVGIYIGNGRIVHATNPTRGVVTDSVTSMPFMGGRRIA